MAQLRVSVVDAQWVCPNWRAGPASGWQQEGGTQHHNPFWIGYMCAHIHADFELFDPDLKTVRPLPWDPFAHPSNQPMHDAPALSQCLQHSL